MILDTLDRSARYEPLYPGFATAFAFLRTITGTETEGRHDLEGDDLFALVQRVATKPLAEARFEAHRRYLDIQYLVRGEETILWAPLHTMTGPTQVYDEVKDYAKWNLGSAPTELRLLPGTFAVFFPEDAHSPCVARETPAEVTKVVVKVRVN